MRTSSINEMRPVLLHSLKLPVFWVDKPVSRFKLSKSRFHLHGINREQTRYNKLVSVLIKEAVSLALNGVVHPPERFPSTASMQSLLDSHHLSDYWRIPALHKLVPLGGRKPSELLASMLELCPWGPEMFIFFTHLSAEAACRAEEYFGGGHQTIRMYKIWPRRLML
jgi:hypothetical protein